MELEVTWGRATKVWWSYLWRNLIIIITGSIVVGIVVGLGIGLILLFLGASIETTQIVTTPIAAIMGLLISIIPMKMILGKDFGEFRLVLVKNENENNT